MSEKFVVTAIRRKLLGGFVEAQGVFREWDASSPEVDFLRSCEEYVRQAEEKRILIKLSELLKEIMIVFKERIDG